MIRRGERSVGEAATVDDACGLDAACADWSRSQSARDGAASRPPTTRGVAPPRGARPSTTRCRTPARCAAGCRSTRCTPNAARQTQSASCTTNTAATTNHHSSRTSSRRPPGGAGRQVISASSYFGVRLFGLAARCLSRQIQSAPEVPGSTSLPRRLEIDHAGAFHHVIVRGVDRRDIFRDDADRVAYCERLSLVFLEDGASCLAWALMPNHVHLLVRTGRRPLSRVMHRVGTRYGRYFNDRHGRVGYLFQGRYHAIAVADDEYLMTLVRYVHSNPLRAGLVASVDELDRHRWSGHAALVGRARCGAVPRRAAKRCGSSTRTRRWRGRPFAR